MILDIVRHTPAWVFLVLVALIALGTRRLRANDIAPRQLLILPVLMTTLAAFGLWQVFGATSVVAVVALVWLAVFGACVAIGASLPVQAGVTYSVASRRIHVPGSAWPLVLMMTIFLSRYAVAVILAMHPALHGDTPFAAAVAALYGLSSGAFAARAFRTWRSAFRRHPESGPAPVVA